jgi:hypothetical protein
VAELDELRCVTACYFFPVVKYFAAVDALSACCCYMPCHTHACDATVTFASVTINMYNVIYNLIDYVTVLITHGI